MARRSAEPKDGVDDDDDATAAAVDDGLLADAEARFLPKYCNGNEEPMLRRAEFQPQS